MAYTVVDTHAHLEFASFDTEREQVIERAVQAGVTTIVNVGTTVAASEQAIALAAKHEGIFATVGTHPTDLEQTAKIDIEKMRELATRPKVVAIGECGLDYSHHNSRSREEQEQIFGLQIQLALEQNLPLIIHCREAWDTIFTFLKKQPLPKLTVPGVFHCFTGSQDDAQEALELGFFISFSCIITYPKNEYLRQIARTIPLNRMTVETDSPFLPPQESRGQRNEPAHVMRVVETIAQVRDTSQEEIAAQTTTNAKRLFHI